MTRFARAARHIPNAAMGLATVFIAYGVVAGVCQMGVPV